jgi:hypothetical protein
MSSAILEQNSLSEYLWRGAFASLLVHALLALFVIVSGILAPTSSPQTEPVLMVSFEPPRPAKPVPEVARQPRQIVSSPDETSKEPPKDPTFLAERDSSAVREQIKRGDDPMAGVVGPKSGAKEAMSAKMQPQRSNKSPKEKPEPKQKQTPPLAKPAEEPAAPKRISSLKLDRSTMLERFSVQDSESTEDRIAAALSGQSSPSRTNSLSDIQPFGRAPGSGARIMGSAGSNDFLPSLPDGDITMLNAKANLYAVFVRRVAVQVFGYLRASGWERLRAEDIQSMTTDTTVRAVLSKEGKLLKVELEDSSGSTRFDEVLHAAVQSGARDPNPPASAALRDGNIHFVFKARSWVRYATDPRSGAPSQRRWLILGTGLD